MPTVRGPRTPNIQKVTTPHELVIRSLIDSHPDMCRNGFRRAMRNLWSELGDIDEMLPIDFVPDAYRIDREAEEILIYEVEFSHPVTEHKLRQYGMLWFDWDAEGQHEWLPRLFIIDRLGQREIPMRELYYRVLEAHAGNRAPLPLPTLAGGR